MKRIVLFIAALALSGCTNLAAVRDVSAQLSGAAQTWDAVGGELADSCRREQQINPALGDCALEAQASAGLVSANAVLANYFQALTDAANESNFTIQPGLDQASASFANVPGVRADQVQAVSGLFSLLAIVANQALREEVLRGLIDRGGSDARTVVQGLDALVGPRLERRLDTERTQLAGQFGRLILAQGDPVGTDVEALCSGSNAAAFSGPGFLLTLEYCRRLSTLKTRLQALADYRASLADADQALATLQSSKTALKTPALARRLYDIGSALQRSVAAVRKAFV